MSRLWLLPLEMVCLLREQAERLSSVYVVEEAEGFESGLFGVLAVRTRIADIGHMCRARS
jgi:hypothetical protein